MKRIVLQDAVKNQKIRNELKISVVEGKVFLYPTDTVYGLGCDATNSAAVKRIRTIKTSDHPFSIIAPSKEWILKNMIVKDKKKLDKLPGKYTLIFKMKKEVQIILEQKIYTLILILHQ